MFCFYLGKAHSGYKFKLRKIKGGPYFLFISIFKSGVRSIQSFCSIQRQNNYFSSTGNGIALYLVDIPNVVTSSIKMFADDTKIYCEINNAEDTLALQSDLDCLENWTRSWQVKFNPQKCEAMRITHKQDKSKHPYHLSNTELKSVNSCKAWVFTCQETYPGRTT